MRGFFDICKADVETLSDAELFALVEAFEDVTGLPIAKAGEKETAVESGIAGELDGEYLEGIDEATAAELGLYPEEMSSEDALRAVSGVGTRLESDLAGDRGVRMGAVLLAGVGAVMTLGREAGIALLTTRGYPTADISASLSLVDRSAVKALSGQQMFWIGRFYSDHLSKTISATVQREALLRGLGKAEVGQILSGVVRGTFPHVKVPGTFNGSSEAYFNVIAGTVRNQASGYGAISTFAEAGVERYRIVAVMDERTTPICEMLHDTTFAVASGVKLANARVSAETPEAAKEVSPWLSVDEVKALPGYDDNPEAALDRAGLGMPPYHALCRTVVVPA